MRNRAIRSKWGRRNRDKGSAATPDVRPAEGKGNGDVRQTFERYLAMAKAAASSGDAVESEKYYQYADHFLRLMKAGAD